MCCVYSVGGKGVFVTCGCTLPEGGRGSDCVSTNSFLIGAGIERDPQCSKPR